MLSSTHANSHMHPAPTCDCNVYLSVIVCRFCQADLNIIASIVLLQQLNLNVQLPVTHGRQSPCISFFFFF